MLLVTGYLILDARFWILDVYPPLRDWMPDTACHYVGFRTLVITSNFKWFCKV